MPPRRRHRAAAVPGGLPGVGDFVPLHDGRGEPLNPPRELGGDDDPGAMAVNYRNAPLRFRGDDPSKWFSSREHRPGRAGAAGPRRRAARVPRPGHRRDPHLPRRAAADPAHPGLARGAARLRAARDAVAPRVARPARPALVNQQTLGISEAFTLDIDPAAASPYGSGRPPVAFNTIDDLWLGCWGLSGRAAGSDPRPSRRSRAGRAGGPVPCARCRTGRSRTAERTFVVVARRTRAPLRGHVLTDPWGLITCRRVPVDRARPRAAQRRLRPRPCTRARDRSSCGPGRASGCGSPWSTRSSCRSSTTRRRPCGHEDDRGLRRPLLRFRGRAVAAGLPLEHVDDLGGRTAGRSPPGLAAPRLLRYDVVSDDGASWAATGTARSPRCPATMAKAATGARGEVVERDGHGSDTTGELARVLVVRRRGAGAGPGRRRPRPGVPAGGPGRHPQPPPPRAVRGAGRLPARRHPVPAGHRDRAGWSGYRGGLRTAPVTGGPRGRAVRAGRAAAVRQRPSRPAGARRGARRRPGGQRAEGHELPHRAGAPPHAARRPRAAHPDDGGARRRPRCGCVLVSAADKPRNHTFTVHGVSWPSAPRPGPGPRAGAVGGITAGSVHDLVFEVEARGDHAYRDGVFRWSVEQGMWGILRVR